ncbi:MAG: GTP-binding protein [Candidatus Heimdallarchaeota archaeon]|nr:GTP-binding protein [Candidatus Heimdallarchaeota archaeon]
MSGNEPLKMFKIILSGDGGVGKTSIRSRYFGEPFTDRYIMTLGTDFGMKRFDNCKIQIWDFAGQKEFASVRKNYYFGTHGMVLIYDLNNEESILNLDYWVDELIEARGKLVPVVIVGNKLDLIEDASDIEDKIKLRISELENKYQFQFNYMFSSAKTGQNVSEMFDFLKGHMEID